MAWGILLHREDELIRDLKETTLSFDKLGEKYGTSKQAIHLFYKRHRITRPPKPEGHQIDQCELCQKLLQISKRPFSDFISIHTIKKELKLKARHKGTYLYHVKKLKTTGLLSLKFGRLHSQRAEKAYSIYFKKRIPISRIGQMVGYKHFYSVIQKHRQLGWDVPPSLFIYDSQKRAKIQRSLHKARRVTQETLNRACRSPKSK